MQCFINDAPVAISEPGATLLSVLRGEAGLLGTRFGCGENACGACHVIIDGVSQAACAIPMWALADKRITTIEGLARSATGKALAAAMQAEQAFQCGYCASGIMMSAAALLQRTPQPDAALVRAALEPHLCRCGAHNAIVRGVMRTATIGAPIL